MLATRVMQCGMKDEVKAAEKSRGSKVFQMLGDWTLQIKMPKHRSRKTEGEK